MRPGTKSHSSRNQHTKRWHPSFSRATRFHPHSNPLAFHPRDAYPKGQAPRFPSFAARQKSLATRRALAGNAPPWPLARRARPHSKRGRQAYHLPETRRKTPLVSYRRARRPRHPQPMFHRNSSLGPRSNNAQKHRRSRHERQDSTLQKQGRRYDPQRDSFSKKHSKEAHARQAPQNDSGNYTKSSVRKTTVSRTD